jgi:hypothetical protein
MMKRGEEARRLIRHGEDPVRMLLAVVRPDHDWAESTLRTRFCVVPVCSNASLRCTECGGRGLVTTTRRRLLAIEALADYVYNAA